MTTNLEKTCPLLCQRRATSHCSCNSLLQFRQIFFSYKILTKAKLIFTTITSYNKIPRTHNEKKKKKIKTIKGNVNF